MSRNTQRPGAVLVGAFRAVYWLANHWLAVMTTFFTVYVGLPFLAPILMANGYVTAANNIYAAYRSACHQLPSRSSFIMGEQIAFCDRDVAIYLAFIVGGLIYGFTRTRLQRIELRWYVFFLVPIALDGGMQLVSPFLDTIPISAFWAIGLIAMGIVTIILQRFNYLTWHSYLFFAFGPLALLYLQFNDGFHLSNWWLRTVTGTIFALGTVWFAYPFLEESFADVRRDIKVKLDKIAGYSAESSSA